MSPRVEDYGALLCLPHMRAYVPAFHLDIGAVVEKLFAIAHPAYLRLGVADVPAGAVVPDYSAWRKLQDGRGWLVLVTGSLAGSLWNALRVLDGAFRPTIWVLAELPCQPIPEEFQADLLRSRRLLLVEEHVEQGGIAQNLAPVAASAGNVPERFVARSAQGYPTGRYGSQAFHRRECGLDGASIVKFLTQGDNRDAA